MLIQIISCEGIFKTLRSGNIGKHQEISLTPEEITPKALS